MRRDGDRVAVDVNNRSAWIVVDETDNHVQNVLTACVIDGIPSQTIQKDIP